ncbi:MAG: HDOD domain-containing protein [Candidatus Brocadia sp. AMX2]|uniref:Signal transduction protein n=1 Tax=Candidatus Brocadia sinica JPN1 TaxID=1197129 RepID=A0ABQ0JYC6_9BACT|nr:MULTISPECIES: HDOD domain-containing protein [Brocadia]MBC6932893.1 HDOD domain-containing protein [Candidatus Brocadia sp.]MBL1167621.1 HDOD domain-containing protein [Candidatus Brocadia sp. AMX1]MCK6467613.1 HDOD domain-containing protein [Candidatus Brocadia sinica]NOG40489.1 HDOD domain-containing protein [Planctomycetota bacterium]KAA0242082.1 MAG: HDOD domain-containing protein [Candidatus Brocadia sp. AMX2]
MSFDKISVLISKINSIPTLPTIACRVMEITADPNSSANDLMKVIIPDISLSTKLLKMANSPFFGATRGVTSLQHAITVLGFKEVRNLVISAVVFESFMKIEKNENYDIGKFWKHSFVCGLAAKIIAAELKKTSNEFFVAGLLHDIGKLVIYITLPNEFFKLVDTAKHLKLKFTAFETEKGIIGMTHDEVGMRLLKKWMFPESLLTAIGFHHRIQETDTKSLLPVVVHIADIFAHIYEMQTVVEEDDPLKTETLFPDIIKLAQLYGIEWDESDLNRLQLALAEGIEKEAVTFRLFFGN